MHKVRIKCMQNIRKIRHIYLHVDPSFRGSSEILPSYAIPHAIPYAIPPFTFTDIITVIYIITSGRFQKRLHEQNFSLRDESTSGMSVCVYYY